MYLCTCNNCGGIFEDTNPGNDSKDYSHGTCSHIVPSLQMTEPDGEGNGWAHSCPVCRTDANLVDNINTGLLHIVYFGTRQAMERTATHGARALNTKTMKYQKVDPDAIYYVEKDPGTEEGYICYSNKNIRVIAKEKGLIM